MDTRSVAETTQPTTTHERGTCAGCGGSGRALQTPRPNVGVDYTGPMYCMPCNLRFRMLDFHHSSLERLSD